MAYKYIGFAAALMMAAAPCFGVRTDLRSLVEEMESSQEKLNALTCQLASTSSVRSPVFTPLMPIERQRIGVIGDSSGHILTPSLGVPFYDEVNWAALRNEDYARLKAGESVTEVVDAAIKRFAREHDVPQEMASSFSVARGKKDIKGALLECIFFALSTRSHKKIDKAFADHSAHFLTQLLKHLSWIGREENNSVGENKRFFFKKIEEGMDFDGAATLLLKSRLCVPGEASPDPVLEPLLKSISIPVRLRASSLEKSPSFIKIALALTRSQDEERALAVLSFLARCENEKQGVAFLAVSSTLSPSYMEMFAAHWPYGMDLGEFSFILAQGDLTEEQLTGFRWSYDRVAIYKSRREFEASLLSRLLASLK